jgi:hypothetical protein
MQMASSWQSSRVEELFSSPQKSLKMLCLTQMIKRGITMNKPTAIQHVHVKSCSARSNSFILTLWQTILWSKKFGIHVLQMMILNAHNVHCRYIIWRKIVTVISKFPLFGTCWLFTLFQQRHSSHPRHQIISQQSAGKIKEGKHWKLTYEKWKRFYLPLSPLPWTSCILVGTILLTISLVKVNILYRENLKAMFTLLPANTEKKFCIFM